MTLSREARAVIAAGRGDLVPTQRDRERVTQLLSDQLGAVGRGLPTPVAGAAGAAPSRWLTLLKVVGSLSLVGALGTVGYVTQRDAQKPPAAQDTVAIALAPQSQLSHVAEVSDAAQHSELPAAATASAEAPKPEAPARPAKLSRDTLGEEVAILSRAEKALHNARPDLALKALDEHQRRFASGALVQERSAARIQALCALGRADEARAESIKLKRNSPNSPQTAQAKLPCESSR